VLRNVHGFGVTQMLDLILQVWWVRSTVCETSPRLSYVHFSLHFASHILIRVTWVAYRYARLPKPCICLPRGSLGMLLDYQSGDRCGMLPAVSQCESGDADNEHGVKLSRME
jgi:hypothetical protein